MSLLRFYPSLSLNLFKMLPKNTILKPGHMMHLICIIYFICTYFGNIKEAGGYQGPLPLELSCFNSEKNYVPSVRNGFYKFQNYFK